LKDEKKNSSLDQDIKNFLEFSTIRLFIFKLKGVIAVSQEFLTLLIKKNSLEASLTILSNNLPQQNFFQKIFFSKFHHHYYDKYL